MTSISTIEKMNNPCDAKDVGCNRLYEASLKLAMDINENLLMKSYKAYYDYATRGLMDHTIQVDDKLLELIKQVSKDYNIYYQKVDKLLSDFDKWSNEYHLSHGLIRPTVGQIPNPAERLKEVKKMMEQNKEFRKIYDYTQKIGNIASLTLDKLLEIDEEIKKFVEAGYKLD